MITPFHKTQDQDCLPMINRALRLIRTYHGMKQKDLVQKLGISQSYLSEVENGTKSVTVDLLEKYSEVFRMPSSSIWLFAEGAKAGTKSMFENMVAAKAMKMLEWLNDITADEDDEKVLQH